MTSLVTSQVRAGSWTSPAKLVVIDFDDTLVSIPVSWQETLATFVREVCAQRSCRPPSEPAQLAAEIDAHRGTSLTEYMQLLSMYLRRQGVAISVSNLRSAFQALWERTSEPHYGPAALVPGAVELLSACQDRGIALRILTGGDSSHKKSLVVRLGLSDYVDDAHVIGDEGQGLDKGVELKRLLGSLAVSSTRAAFVADGPKDMDAARRSGVLGVGLGLVPGADVCDISGSFSVELLQLLTGSP